MSDTQVTCPKCGAAIPLTEAVSHSLKEKLEGEFQRRIAESDAALRKREAKIESEKAAINARAGALQAEVSRLVDAARQRLLADAAKAAEERLGVQMRDLQARVADQQSRLQVAQEAELALRKQKQQLEDARAALELDVARRLDEERRKIADAARQQGAESEKLKLADKDNTIRALQDQINALKLRAEQGSIQIQGETLELDLERQLRTAFPFDEVSEVKKGQRGADVVQEVRIAGGAPCGVLLWEAKRAKNWSPEWPEKLKADQREAGADLAVVVTTCPPAGIRGIGQADGVWVCEPAFATALAAALRQGLISTSAQRVQQANRADKAQALYDHLCGIGFRQQVEAIVDAFVGLRAQLDSEQRAFARQWKEREHQLQKAITHTAMLYGGIQGIAGREALPEIQPLALPTAD